MERETQLTGVVLVMLAAGACTDGREVSPLATVELTLESRTGTSRLGWSFAEERLVPGAVADLTTSSSDCGARGRWVMLEGRGVTFCYEVDGRCADTAAIDIGGTEPEVPVGANITMRRGNERIGALTLLDRTDTPDDWYLDPERPFVDSLALLED